MTIRQLTDDELKHLDALPPSFLRICNNQICGCMGCVQMSIDQETLDDYIKTRKARVTGCNSLVRDGVRTAIIEMDTVTGVQYHG